jgi:hypothetical protein
MIRRVDQFLLVATLAPLCWLLMMAVHEGGHFLCANVSNGKVTSVVLHPLAISRTDVSPNPHPLIVCWGGPVFGCLAPLAAWQICRILCLRFAFLVRFFAGFCCIANGTYIAFGSFEGIGDAGELLRLGMSPFLLWSFGALTLPTGFFIWHGTGADFGFGPHAKPVDPSAPRLTAISLVIVVSLELLFGHT